MPQWLGEVFESSSSFMPHGHCYLWIPSILWMHVISDTLIGIAYLGISILLYLLVRKIRLPFSPVFIAFGLFIGLCGLTHFMSVWTVWNPDYFVDGLLKVATAAASVATAIGLIYVRPQVEEVVHTARLSEERRIRLESTHAELESLYSKVKQLDEVKTRFFANVSHELRTPLALMLGPAERMLGDTNLTQDQRRQLESMSRNGKSLLKQVNDLLDVAKLEAGQMQIDYAKFDLAPWFRQVASQFEVAAEQRHIRYTISAPDSLPAEVDPDMLQRVVINLLSNAFKFTPQDGAVSADLRCDKNEVYLSVTDTGPGISADQHKSIFERFHQAEGGTTRTHGGTGLGLAIVKDFVALHGGQVEVVSNPGSGAKFIVRLPLSAPAHVVVTRSSHTPGPTTNAALEGTLQDLAADSETGTTTDMLPHFPDRASVLVVEDNQEMSHFIASILSDEYNIVTAIDGQEGLERALALQPDLIVTDIMMPRMSGDQLVSALRVNSQFDAVPILLLTAKADDDLRVSLLQTGAQDYLTKPFLPQELLARASNLVSMKRAGDALRSELASASNDVEELAKGLAAKHRQLHAARDAAEVAREQAERASQVKSQFLGMISHELRTPLSTLNMNVQLLSRPDGSQLPEAFKPRLDRMRRATRQLSTLVEGLLEYTRVESGKLAAQVETVNAYELMQDIIETQQDNVPPEVLLVLAPSPPELAPLVTDPRLLQVILNNLVSNALKFTSQGTVTLRLNSTETHHVFDVCDTGIGIPEADIARIFMPFEQLEPIHRKSIPGVGLGLALVKQMVEALGGKIMVSSQQGTGSTFSLELPSRLRNVEVATQY